MNRRRLWSGLVDVAALVWVVLFAVDLAVGFDLLAVGAARVRALELALRAMLAVFLADVLLLYRWSEQAPLAFARTNWFYVLTVFPWFRPFRLLRAGRVVRSLRVLTRSRRVGSFLNKARRVLKRSWNRLFG